MFPIDYADRKPLGKSGEKILAIGIGTWAIRDYSKAKEALIHAIELGLNMIDTAEMYDKGKAEELIGEVIRIVGRENVFITTKLLPEHFSNVDNALKAAQASLRRLGVEYILMFRGKVLYKFMFRNINVDMSRMPLSSTATHDPKG